MRKIVPCLVLAAVAGLGLGACGDDDSDPLVPPPVDLRPTSPDRLVQQFQSALDQLDFHRYAPLIDPSFVLELQQATVDDYALPDRWFTATTDLLATEAAFSGAAAPRTGEVPAAGLDAVQVNLLQKEAEWAIAPAGSPYFGTYHAPYLFDATFGDVNGLRTTMRGVLDFYVLPDTLAPGDVRWQLAGLVDATEAAQDKRVAGSLAWGDLKALFRPAPGI